MDGDYEAVCSVGVNIYLHKTMFWPAYQSIMESSLPDRNAPGEVQ